MLAAAPISKGEPSIFRLVLSLRQSNTKEIPQLLITAFDSILDQAKFLASESFNAKEFADVNPEAVSLAFEMKLFEQLSNRLEEVKSYNNLTPELADNLLKDMEACSVYCS